MFNSEKKSVFIKYCIFSMYTRVWAYVKWMLTTRGVTLRMSNIKIGFQFAFFFGFFFNDNTHALLNRD